MKHDLKAGPAVRKLSVVEAAVVAAGFEYRAVKSSEDCPPSFSRPLAGYTIGLEKYGPEDVKRRLLVPLAALLANTARKDEVEFARVRFLALETFRRVISMFCFDELKDLELACRCRSAKDISDVQRDCFELSGGVCCVPVKAALMLGERSWRKLPFRPLHYATLDIYHGDAEMAAYDACEAVRLCCLRGGIGRRRKYFTVAAQILSEAIMLGDHRANSQSAEKGSGPAS